MLGLIYKNMKVPNKILRLWRKELDSTDDLKMEASYGINKRTARRAREEGTCSENTMNQINAYLSVKKYNENEFVKQFKA